MPLLWPLLLLVRGGAALRLPFTPPGRAPAAERALIETIGTSTPELLKKFEQLEEAFPPPPDLLLRSGPPASLLDGRWELTATVAATVGEGVAGGTVNVVNASGIAVRTDSRQELPVQEIDLASSRIGNELRFTLFGVPGYVRVAGGFTADTERGRRALVKFDTCDVFLRGSRLVRAGAIFSILRRVKPSLQNGADDAAWLETTYLSPTMRLGRGNKGSIFVLQRESPDAAPPPLADWPL